MHLIKTSYVSLVFLLFLVYNTSSHTVRIPLHARIHVRTAPTNHTTTTNNSSRTPTEQDDCHACELLRQELHTPITPEQMRLARLEDIKRTILQKLRLERPPNVSRPVDNLPTSLLERHRAAMDRNGESETEVFYAETNDVVVLTNRVLKCGPDNHSVCIQMTLNHDLDTLEISSAKLQVKYRPILDEYDDLTYVLKLYDITNRRQKYLTQSATNIDIPWTSLNIRSHIQQKVTQSVVSRNVTFKIVCPTCDKLLEELKRHKPYLEITTRPAPSRKRRRVIRCQDGYQGCCRADLYVSFAELGWDNWVLEPRGYRANYCTGSCVGMQYLPAYHHSRIVAGVRHISYDVRRKMNSCCIPTKLSPTSMCYLLDDGTLKCSNIPDMVVESCGCI